MHMLNVFMMCMHHLMNTMLVFPAQKDFFRVRYEERINSLQLECNRLLGITSPMTTISVSTSDRDGTLGRTPSRRHTRIDTGIKMPIPEKFSRERRKTSGKLMDVNQWLDVMQCYINTSYTSPDDSVCANIYRLNLAPDVQEYLTNTYNKRDGNFWQSSASVIAALRAEFVDVNKKENARKGLLSLKMDDIKLSVVKLTA